MQKPFVIAVAGGSGSGKTTVARNIMRAAGTADVVYIPHDAYYRDQSSRSMTERIQTNYDHPDAFETSLLVSHVQALLAGQRVERPTYDFTQHTRSTETETLIPAKVIIVEGIMVLESERLRPLLDLKVFVDTDPDIRFIRRLTRDINERGRTAESVIEQYTKTVRPMHLEFVEPSKRYADVIIPEGGENQLALDLLLARIREVVSSS